MTREEAISILYRIAEYFKEWDGSTPAPTMELNIDELRQIASMNVERCSLREALRQERPKGRWIGWHTDKVVGVDDIGDYIYRHCHYYSCRLCGRRTAVKSNYCPECGADMRGEEA